MATSFVSAATPPAAIDLQFPLSTGIELQPYREDPIAVIRVRGTEIFKQGAYRNVGALEADLDRRVETYSTRGHVTASRDGFQILVNGRVFEQYYVAFGGDLLSAEDGASGRSTVGGKVRAPVGIFEMVDGCLHVRGVFRSLQEYKDQQARFGKHLKSYGDMPRRGGTGVFFEVPLENLKG